MATANYSIVKESSKYVVLNDLGPWDKFLTITNDAENVVKTLKPILLGRRLYYYDSDGDLSELKINGGGKFVGFATGETFKDLT